MSSTMARKSASTAPGIQVVIGPGAGVGQMLGGVFLGPSTFDPLAGYPPAEFDPAASGFAPAGGGVPIYAGTIAGSTTRDRAPVSLFCLDIRTTTGEGLGYAAQRWAAAGVAHLGAAGRVVARHGPRIVRAQDAAAAQLAVWFFTDHAVVCATSPLFPLVSEIVSGVLAKGPLAEPPRRAIERAAPGTVLRYTPTDPARPRPPAAQTLILAHRPPR